MAALRLPSLLLFLAPLASGRPTRGGKGLRAEPVRDDLYECPWREAAYRHAGYLQPWLLADTGKMRMLFDALQLETLCNHTFPDRMTDSGKGTVGDESAAADEPCTFFVSPDGSDSATGSRDDPVATLGEGLKRTRACKGKDKGAGGIIVLTEGTHFLAQTLALDSRDSGLRITSEGPGAVLSGAVSLGKLGWKPYRDGIFVASVAEAPSLPKGIRALHVEGRRATRARFPNADPELDLFPMGYISDDTSWGLPLWHGEQCDTFTFCGPSTTKEMVNVTENGAWKGMFQNYSMGFGGSCLRFSPPESPFCSDVFYTQRMLPEMHVRSPSSIFADAGLLPNYPYKQPVGAQIHTWKPGHWFSWMFEVNGTIEGPELDDWLVLDGYSNVVGQIEPRGYADLVRYLGDFNTSDGCWAEFNDTAEQYGCKSWSWYSPEVEDWGSGCYCHYDYWWNPVKVEGAVSGFPPGKKPDQLTFGAGGHQGAEGEDYAGEWWIENVFEELDAPNEYFYDEEEQLLYFYYNSSDGSPPPSAPDSITVPTLVQLIQIVGDPGAPVSDIVIDNLEFTGTRPTYLEGHGIPSGGDWALQRTGAIFLEGTENVVIANNTFRRLESNAVMVSGYNRGTNITRNEFAWLGMNAVALWGRIKGNDGTGGEQPRFVNFESNLCYEVGLWQKQSSCYFQALSAQNRISGNIAFNIPRAAVNFNDGFGGGNEMNDNLLFNTCRESSDHGAFNSWDRLPYVTKVRDGTPSTVPGNNNMHHNFIVANYMADGGCFDNDDGSSYYIMHHNFCIYGGHKVDFDGHNKVSYASIHVYPQAYFPGCLVVSCQTLPPVNFGETYKDNVCILAEQGATYLELDQTNISNTSEYKNRLIMNNNTIYIPGGASKASVLGDNGENITLATWKKMGNEPDTTVIDGKPSPSELMGWGEAMLRRQE